MWVTKVHGAGFDLGYVVRDPASVGEAVYAVAETGLALLRLRRGLAAAAPHRATHREALAVALGVSPWTFRWSRR